MFYDEIVVVNTMCNDQSGERHVQVTALKLVHHPDGTCTLQKLGDSFEGRYGYNPEFVAVTIGDLDIRMPELSDKDKKDHAVYSARQNEFAVAVAGNYVGWTQVLWFQIDTQDPDNPKLVQHAGTEIKTQCLHLDMTAGDFDGDGQDELCIVHRSVDGKGRVLYALLEVVDTETETPSLKQTAGDYLVGDKDHITALEGEIRVVSGLFKLDPNNGYGFNRKQVMAAFASGNSNASYIDYKNCAVIGVFQPGLDGNGNMGIEQLCIFWQSPLHDAQKYTASLRHIDLAVGNFVGHGSDGKAQSPTEQGLLSYQLWWFLKSLGIRNVLDIFIFTSPPQCVTNR